MNRWGSGAGVGLFAVVCSLAGCALVIDPPSAVDIPDQPQLDVSPDDPHALDELEVTVTNPQSFTEYNFTWCRLATASSSECEALTEGIENTLLSSTLTNAVTKRYPEVYRVTVVTNIVNTDISGESKTEEIVIADTPSQLASARLDKYRVVEGESISATPASFVDPDNPNGVGVGLRYQWYVNSDVTPIRDEIVANVRTGDTLDLSDPELSAAPEVDDLIKVVITPDDSNLKAATTMGPVRVISDTTRWLPILPNRQFGVSDSSSVVYDEKHERFVMIDGNIVWEAVVADSDTFFTKLYPTGTHTLGLGQKAFFDPDLAAKPVIVMMQFEFGGVGGSDGYVIYNLDVTQRGSEAWARIEPTGDLPTTVDAHPTVYYDKARDRLFLLPSCDNPSPYIWRLDLGASSATWTRLTFSASAGVVEKSTVIAHPTIENRFLVIGGTTSDLIEIGPEDWECDESSIVLRSPVYRIDVPDAAPPTLQEIIRSDNLPLLPPEAHVYSAAVAHPDGKQILVSEGLVNRSGVLSESHEMWLLDLETLLFDTTALPSSQIVLAASDAIYNPNRKSFVFWHASTVASNSDMAFVELNDIGNTFTWNRSYFEQGVHLPAALSSAQVWGSTNIEVTGGLRYDQTVSRALWRLNAATRKWTAGNLDMAGKSRYAVSVASRETIPSPRYLARGLAAPSILIPGNPWILDEGELAWDQIDFSPAAGAEVYTGSLILPLSDLSCGALLASRQFLIYGGALVAFVTSNYTYWTCNAFSPSSCSQASAVAPISARANATAAIFGTETSTTAVLFGGSGADNSLTEIQPCQTSGPAVTWTAKAATGDLIAGLPLARTEHVMTVKPGVGVTRTMFISAGKLLPAGTYTSDVWKLENDGVGGSYVWTKIALDPSSEVPTSRGSHVAAWDANKDALLIYGGQGSQPIRSDMWELRIR